MGPSNEPFTPSHLLNPTQLCTRGLPPMVSYSGGGQAAAGGGEGGSWVTPRSGDAQPASSSGGGGVGGNIAFAPHQTVGSSGNMAANMVSALFSPSGFFNPASPSNLLGLGGGPGTALAANLTAFSPSAMVGTPAAWAMTTPLFIARGYADAGKPPKAPTGSGGDAGGGKAQGVGAGNGAALEGGEGGEEGEEGEWGGADDDKGGSGKKRRPPALSMLAPT